MEQIGKKILEMWSGKVKREELLQSMTEKQLTELEIKLYPKYKAFRKMAFKKII